MRPPAIGEAIGMGAALDYLQAIGLDRIHADARRCQQRQGLVEDAPL